jgi:hypothetical protein
VLNKLRQKHAVKDDSGRNIGIDVNTGALGGECVYVCVCGFVGSTPDGIIMRGTSLGLWSVTLFFPHA